MPRNPWFLALHIFQPIKKICMSGRLLKRKVKHSKVTQDLTIQGASKRRKGQSSSSNTLILPSPVPMMNDPDNKEVGKSIGNIIYLPNPVKSENDKKDYRVLQLPNGMKVLLISDPNISENEPTKAPISDGVDNMAYSSAEEEGSQEEEGEEEESGEEKGEEEEQESEQSDEDDSEPEPESMESSSGAEHNVKPRKDRREGDRMAAASLSVKVGSFSDPADIPGLAHFLEHMVFMGSKNFPQENAFDEFLKTYGGSSNASTDCETTTFEFEVHQRHFRESLVIFAQFFASPLLLPESMNREKEAIDSEFQMALPSDSCRKQQLFGGLARDNHPMGKFMWGNSTTLNLPDDPKGVELNRRLRLFWQEHYTADRMTVVLQSKHELDQMEEWAVSSFKDIPSSGKSSVNESSFKEFGLPFDTSLFNRIVQVVPVKDVKQVCMTWALPSQQDKYRTKPLGYISWLVGHEGRGSLLAYLRRKVWALDLASGNDESGFEHNSTYASFSINISLTERGMAELEQVIHAVFQYIDMLKERGPDRRIWSEIQAIERLSFRYAEDVPPVENVETLSENMLLYAPTDYITGDCLIFYYDHQAIMDCTNALRTDNVNIMIMDKEFEKRGTCNEVEPWFKTHYNIKDIPVEWRDLWSKSMGESPFALPEANPYLASDFTLLAAPSDSSSSMPTRIAMSEDDGISLWFRPDAKFRIPKAVLNFYLVSPLAMNSPKNAALLEVLGKMLKHQLMEKVYDALVAQLEFSIHHYDRGLIIKVSGFNHKLHLLIDAIVEQFARFEQDALLDVFEALKEQQGKAYRNYVLKPSKLVTDARLTLLHTSYWSVLDKAEALTNLTLDDLKTFTSQLKATFKLEGLVQGNYSQDQALDVARRLKNQLQPAQSPEGSLPPVRIRQLPIGEKCCRIASFHPTDSNSVVVNYYQVGATNLHQTAVMEILVNLMEEPVFDVLRTREQLGYNVYATLRNTFGVLGFSITVDFQADKFSASHVDERIEDFLAQFDGRLTAMTDDELATRVQSLIKLKQLPDVSLDEEVSRNWNEILGEEYLFDRLEQEVDHLRRVGLEEIRSFFRIYAHPSHEQTQRRKLSMQVLGAGKRNHHETQPASDANVHRKMDGLRLLYPEPSSSCVFIQDVNLFRESCQIYPPLKTFNGLPIN